MNKPRHISHSQVNCYSTCEYKYFMYYINRFRSKYVSSALLFGKALDEALNCLLLEKNMVKAIKTFKQHFTFCDVNGDTVYLPGFKYVTWLATDHNDAFVPAYKKGKSSTWDAMFYKGIAMLKAYNRDILPRLSDIGNVQREIKLVDPETGDTVKGFADLTCRIDGSERCIADNKSAGRAYKEDSVVTSQQLALYSKATGIKKAAYLVMIKTPKKDANKKYYIPTQIIINDIPETLKEATVGVFTETNNSIRRKIESNEPFKKNLNACHNQFGRECDYANYCHHKRDDDLVYVAPEEKTIEEDGEKK